MTSYRMLSFVYKIIMDQIIGAVSGFIAGIIATWCFWKYMLFLSPRVSISPQVAKGTRNEGEQNIYRFKIRNNGKRQAINVSLVVTLCRLLDVPGGRISSNIGTTLPEKSISALAEYSTSWTPWELPPIYIFVAKPDFDVQKELERPNTRMLATLSVTDAQSGTTNVQRVTYKKEDLIEGNFVKGLSFEIKNTK